VVREYPTCHGAPYYPMPRSDNEGPFKRYVALVMAESNVCFVGRLAEYRCYNMDQVVGNALAWVEKQLCLAAICRASSGLGPITSSDIVATVGDPKQFKSGRQFAVWLGLVPRQR
jgi:hypothetical protein